MKLKYLICIIFLTFLLPVSTYATKDTVDSKDLIDFEVTYIGDNINNLKGGIKTGSSYLGLAKLQASFDFDKARLWRGGQFLINAINTHGATPSANLLGDIQIASNIEAGNHTFFQEIWLKQSINKLELTLGLQDLNVEFANSEYGALFLNSSFGMIPIISNNLSAPIFPLTSLGLTLKWKISDQYTFINALFDGTPTDFSNNPYNLKWQFKTGDGLLAISEIQYKNELNRLSGTYKLGAFTHNHFFEKFFNKNFPDSIKDIVFGFYAYADQEILKFNDKTLGLFGQLGLSPTTFSRSNFYFGLGMNFTGLFSKKGNDILGLAVAHGSFSYKLFHETSIELTYQYPISKNIFFQPDIQYIINPAGKDEILKNCFTTNFRFIIQL